MSAVDLTEAIRRRSLSAREATQSVLDRIDAVNPRINALVKVFHAQALAAADQADAALASGQPVGPLHGVPVTVKINVDLMGEPTTDGLVPFKDNLASSDSPVVANLRRAGAIVVGRSNAPAMSLRWFTDNDLHGRTLNPFDAARTPGGSSGGAAAATATGMGAIAHGNDYGGSIRHPAWACGVVGLRPTVGRIPSYRATGIHRVISNQMMSVQGPLTRTVADARLALAVMSQGSPLDPKWTPAPLRQDDTDQAPLRVAVFKSPQEAKVDASVRDAVDRAAHWLSQAGCVVEEVAPPRFDEAAALWRMLVGDDMRRSAVPFARAHADRATNAAIAGYLDGLPDSTRDQYLDGLVQRFNIARAWAVFHERHPVLLMPNSWTAQAPIDFDVGGAAQVLTLLQAHAPLLATAMLGLPGLSVPTGMHDGLPTGVLLSCGRFREDLALRAGELIERTSGFSALDQITSVHAPS
jgi:amidase